MLNSLFNTHDSIGYGLTAFDDNDGDGGGVSVVK